MLCFNLRKGDRFHIGDHVQVVLHSATVDAALFGVELVQSMEVLLGHGARPDLAQPESVLPLQPRCRFERRYEDNFYIGDTLVCVTELRRSRVQVGISAPCHVPVHRASVFEEILWERAGRPRRWKGWTDWSPYVRRAGRLRRRV